MGLRKRLIIAAAMAGLMLTAQAKPLVAPIAAYFGYPEVPANGNYPGFTVQWDNFVKTIGRAPSLYLIYLDQRFAPDDTQNGWGPYSAWVSHLMQQDNRTTKVTPVLGVPFGYHGANGPVNLFARIASGGLDTAIQQLLAAWKSNDYNTMYLRPAWEYNVPNTYAVTASNLNDFQAAWKHFYTVVRNYAAANGMTINVIWNPNIGKNQNSPSLTTASQYPGNAYVDVIGIDSYGAPLDYWHPPLATTSDPTQYLLSTMFQMAKANNKPVAVCEVGGIDKTFVTDFVKTMTGQSVPIEFIGLWDTDDPSGDLSWSNTSDNQGALASLWINALGPLGTIRNY
jgi:hypothetical protein